MEIIFDMVLPLLCGLALFLFGMDLMGDSLKKSAGSGLKAILGKMTSNPIKGFLLGLVVTMIIQSSSATTVMVVGFVNSGTMTLLQAVGVIMGANVGTAITAWITGLSGIGSDSAEGVVDALSLLKPDSWVPIVAVIAICLIMFVSRGKKRDIGFILIGFVILMTGMDMMSAAVSGLKENETFISILTMFENPILGVLAGLILTAIVQSSSASVGILQALTATGGITFGAAIPIIMGQNIGTCVTAMISSISASKNGKRAALIHLYFNIIAVVIVLSGFYLINWLIGGFQMNGTPFLENVIDMWGIAAVHTIFKIIAVAILAPFYRQLAHLAEITIKDSAEEKERANLLDERLIATPAIAVQRATEVTAAMAEVSCDALRKSLSLFEEFDPKVADEVRNLESKADSYEDSLGSYLVRVSSADMNEYDSRQITKLLHIIGDFERISDHAVNIVESAEEMRDKKIEFSAEAKHEMQVLRQAVGDILNMAESTFVNNDIALATDIEPLEQVVDDLRDRIKLNHILRLQKSECTIEHGFILADLLNNFERVSDHCSNIGCCVVEISTYDSMDVHKYLSDLRHGEGRFEEKYAEYKDKYAI
ncbi:MAG: Na/Pi cotransporter family protein [Ruminococcaceae bacterium]|nr:Na/Pi cotransporter family protein [Oscillospiraceae bacterium]